MKTKVALQGALGVGLSVCAALLLSACGGKVNMAEFNEAFYQGDKENALKIAKGGKGVLWDYQSGVNAFWLGESKEAAKLLKSADEGIEKAQEKLINTGYSPYVYESVLLDLYTAYNYGSQDDAQKARPALNRAHDKQNQAKETFAKKIEKQQKQVEDLKAKIPEKVPLDKLEGQISQISSKFKVAKEYEKYKGFVNPYVTYVSALSAMIEGDRPKAENLYKQIDKVVENNEILNKDFELMASGDTQKRTWILIEDGSIAAKWKEPYKLDPAIGILISEAVGLSVPLDFTFYIPKLEEGKSAFGRYRVNGETIKLLSSLDAVAANELQAGAKMAVTLSILQGLSISVAKALATEAAASKFGALGAVGTKVAADAATDALMQPKALESISTLPKQYLAVSIPNTGDEISVKGDGKEIFNAKLETCGEKSGSTESLCADKNTILVLRATSANAPVNAQIIKEQ